MLRQRKGSYRMKQEGRPLLLHTHTDSLYHFMQYLGVGAGAEKLRNELSLLCRKNSSPPPPFTHSCLRQSHTVKNLHSFSVSLHNTLWAQELGNKKSPDCQQTWGPLSELGYTGCISGKDIFVNKNHRVSKVEHTALQRMDLQQQSYYVEFFSGESRCRFLSCHPSLRRIQYSAQ